MVDQVSRGSEEERRRTGISDIVRAELRFRWIYLEVLSADESSLG